MIAVEGLDFRFRDSAQDALTDVSLTIAPGEFVVVTGPSGCGKSTLALALSGILFRQYDGEARGSVRVAGMDARRQAIYDLAEVVGLVQQNPELQFCTLTVQDEVAFGLENRRLPRAEIVQQIDWALGVTGARHLAGRSLATLSGGEKQKVAIAAVMATRPRVLILDEPTSNLDPTATADLFRVIEQIRAEAGMTVVVIEHKVEALLRRASTAHVRLITMEAGCILHDGRRTPEPGSPPSARGPVRDLARRKVRPASNGDRPLVRVEGLHAGYNGRAVLRGLSLEVGAGELVAVMGDNGSGKTTLLQCLLGLLKPGEGSVEILGHDTRRTPVSQLARQVGTVFQNPDHQIFAETVWDEAAFAPRNFGALDAGAEARIGELLAHSGLEGRGEEHPYRLSYGQKRRLNLVSVLSYHPRLVLLDEILIGQDERNAAFLMDLLSERVEAGDAVVMVNHAPRVTQRYATRLLFLEGGRVTVDAPPAEAFAKLEAMGKVAYVP